MEELWNDLSTRKREEELDQDEEKFFKQWVKALGYLAADPDTTVWPRTKSTT